VEEEPVEGVRLQPADVVPDEEVERPRRRRRRRRRRKRAEAQDEASRWRRLASAMQLGRRIDARSDLTPEGTPWVLRRLDGSRIDPEVTRRDGRTFGPNDLDRGPR